MVKKVQFKMIAPIVNGLGDELSGYARGFTKGLEGLPVEDAERDVDLIGAIRGYESAQIDGKEAERRSCLVQAGARIMALLALDEKRRGAKVIEREAAQYDASGRFTKRSG